MPLLSLWSSNPDAVSELSVEQVVSTAGDGNLRDGSACSRELRQYLGEVSAQKISAYVEHCLSPGFKASGLVLQDLVNELGRRLDYSVQNGRYQGVSGGIGFDGLWNSPEGHTIVVEVKTTDAYRVSLDTIAGYRTKLHQAAHIPGTSSILIVVGRQDTGELEAQVRGSRHAWDVRLISAEALIKLVQLKEDSDGVETGRKIRSLLEPVEYTRLDRMVDVMFTTAKDVEASATQGLDMEPGEENPDAISVPAPLRPTSRGQWQFTDSRSLQEKRDGIVAALGRRESAHLIKRSRALYWSADREVRAACAISKRYEGKGQNPYWYAYHPQWDEFLLEGSKAYFVLGCMDLDVAFAIPRHELEPLLGSLNTTSRNGSAYWHIHLAERSGSLSLLLPRKSASVALDQFRLPLN